MSYQINDLLSHILMEIEYLMNHSNISEDDFMFDETLQRAFVRSLEIIGEASKKLPDSLKLNCKEIPWREMSAVRNRLIHEYFGIDYSIVWDIVKNEIPNIKPIIIKLLKENP